MAIRFLGPNRRNFKYNPGPCGSGLICTVECIYRSGNQRIEFIRMLALMKAKARIFAISISFSA